MHHHKRNTRVEGSIPCGNPKRYGSRDVVHMQQAGSFGRKRRHSHEDVTSATEGEKHLRNLLQLQTKTDTTITEQFSRHRSFSLATSHDPGAEKLIGVHKYEKFKAVNDLDARVDYLRHCGLDDEEITLKLMEEVKDKVPVRVGGYGTNPQSKLQKLREIERKMQEKEESLKAPDTFKGALELSRQALELEKSSCLRQGKESLIANIITIPKKLKETHLDDPINHIPEMLCDIEGKKKREPRRERRRRRKQEQKILYYAKFDIDADGSNHNVNNIDDAFDKHDSDEMNEDLTHFENKIKSSRNCICDQPGSISRPAEDVADEISTSVECSQIHLGSDTIRDKLLQDIPNSECHSKRFTDYNTGISLESTKAVKTVNTQMQFISTKEILRNRLSLEKIRAIDKFKNYTEGEPNKVVYVKNLPNKTTEEDLVLLFGSFQSDGKPQIVFKLLSGRMKGQAFITFPDETTAIKAVKLINGYMFQDRPMILSFGKKKDA